MFSVARFLLSIPLVPHRAQTAAVALLVGLGLALGIVLTSELAPADANDFPPALVCYQAANEQTNLDSMQIRILCRSANVIGPVRCYRAATDRTSLASHEKVELCRCANSTLPAECYEQVDDETDMSTVEILEMCNAGALDDAANPNCVWF
jgi:hypothetical protein